MRRLIMILALVGLAACEDEGISPDDIEERRPKLTCYRVSRPYSMKICRWIDPDTGDICYTSSERGSLSCHKP